MSLAIGKIYGKRHFLCIIQMEHFLFRIVVTNQHRFWVKENVHYENICYWISESRSS